MPVLCSSTCSPLKLMPLNCTDVHCLVKHIRQNAGLVLVYLFSLHLPWRPLAALLLALPAVALACLLPLPETPYWLARCIT